MKRRCEADYYGASHVVAAKLGLREPPKSLSTWVHGWIGAPSRHPRQIVFHGDKQQPHLVATEKDALLLRENGFLKTVAVGLPFVYVDDVAIPRQANSLLVMPPHSLAYGDPQWNQDEYVSAICRLVPQFSCVAACISANCVEKGLWVTHFEQHAIPWVVGASSHDRNALVRMRRMFCSFEYMTTNKIGSHVPYAAYCGCKVFFHGRYENGKEAVYTTDEIYKHNRWFRDHPDAHRMSTADTQEDVVRRHYPQFFVEPTDAAEQREWAAEICGQQFRKSPREIARLLGWSWHRQLSGRIKRDYKKGGVRRVLATQKRKLKRKLVPIKRRIVSSKQRPTAEDESK